MMGLLAWVEIIEIHASQYFVVEDGWELDALVIGVKRSIALGLRKRCHIGQLPIGGGSCRRYC